MLLQNNVFLHPIGKWGYYLVNIFNMAEKFLDRKISPKQAFIIMAKAWEKAWIDENFDSGQVAFDPIENTFTVTGRLVGNRTLKKESPNGLA